MLQPGDQIDIWVVERPLGSGGMGSVYRCHNARAKRILAAVKVLEGSFRVAAEAEARFIREAEILFTLDHPNIVKVRNVRTDVDPAYLEMEFVEGNSLEDLLRRGALPMQEAVRIIQQISDAVAYLHSKSIRHRDIKPANVLVRPDGTAKLVDFGLAVETNTTRITQAGMTFGTVSYAPPEWVTPDTLKPELWDIYACGVVFWEMLTGKVAFPTSGAGSARQQAMQVILAKQNHEPLDPGEQFHDDIRSLIRDLTHSEASERIGDAQEMAARAHQLAGELVRDAGPTLMPTRDVRRYLADKVDRSTPGRILRRFGGAASDTYEFDEAIDLEEAKSSAARRRTRSVALALALLAFFVIGGAVLLAAISVYATSGSSGEARAVAVAFKNSAEGVSLDSRLGERTPTKGPDGALVFGAIPPGTHTLRWVQGSPDCTVALCQDDATCPTWCSAQRQDVTVEPGEEPYALDIFLEAPVVQELKLSLSEPLEVEVTASLGGETIARADDGTWALGPLPPGAYPVVLTAGSCPDALTACAEDCPPGCRRITHSLEVAWMGGDAMRKVSLPAPPVEPKPEEIVKTVVDPIVKPTITKPTTTKPTITKPTTTKPTEPSVPTGSAAARVTNAQFASFIRSNPDWGKSSAREKNLADDNYLSHFSDGQPPSGEEARPVVNISFYAANAYCRSRGGLASKGASPSKWNSGADGIEYEWRRDGSNGTLLTSSGSEQLSTLRAANFLTGFRCAR